MHKNGSVYIIIAAILWGMIGIFVRRINAFGLSAINIVGLRALGASVFLFLYLFFTDRSMLKLKKQDIWIFAGTGIGSMIFFNMCYFGSIAHTSLAIAVALLYTAPAFVAIFAALFLKEKLTKRNVITVVMAVIGCALSSGVFNGEVAIDLYGLLLGLGSGVGYALYSIFGKKAIEKGYSDITITFYTFVFALVGSFWAITPELGLKQLPSIEIIPSAMGLIVFSTILAYILYTKGLAMVTASRAAVLSCIEPVVATLISLFIFKEPYTGITLAGVILIIFSAII